MHSDQRRAISKIWFRPCFEGPGWTQPAWDLILIKEISNSGSWYQESKKADNLLSAHSSFRSPKLPHAMHTMHNSMETRNVYFFSAINFLLCSFFYPETKERHERRNSVKSPRARSASDVIGRSPSSLSISSSDSHDSCGQPASHGRTASWTSSQNSSSQVCTSDLELTSVTTPL